MKHLSLTSLLFFVALSFASGKKDSSANNNSKDADVDISKFTESKTRGSNSIAENPGIKQQKADFTTPQRSLLFGTRLAEASHEFFNAANPDRNVYLVDDTGRYNLQIQNFDRARPSHFNAALGAISAHILNQRTNQEYVPYPPNGDPYNYPAYRGGHPRGPEPPAIRAYEIATNGNYGARPSADFGGYNPRRIFSNNGYQQEFPNQFDDFGPGPYNPDVSRDEGFPSGFQSRSDPISDDVLFEEFRKPIKRFA